MFDFKNINIRLLAMNIVIFISAFLWNDPLHFFESSYETAEKLLKIKSVSDIDALDIHNGGKVSFQLIKSDKGWVIRNTEINLEYLADSSKIDKSLERVLDCRKYYEVTDKDERYKEFQVDENSLWIDLKSGDKSYALHIGKQGSSFNTSLVRLKKEKIVYSVRGNLSSDWNQDLNYFRNKKMFSFTKDNIKAVYASGPKNFDLHSGESNIWFLKQGAGEMDTDSIKVNRLLDDITLIEGIDFYPGANTGFNYGNIKVLLKSNIEFNLQINKVGKDYIIKSETNPYWQRVSEYRIGSLFPNPEELKENSNHQP